MPIEALAGIGAATLAVFLAVGVVAVLKFIVDGWWD